MLILLTGMQYARDTLSAPVYSELLKTQDIQALPVPALDIGRATMYHTPCFLEIKNQLYQETITYFVTKT